MVTYSGLIYMFCVFVTWINGFKFRSAYLQEKKPFFKYFSIGAFLLGFGCFFLGIFSFITPYNSFLLEIGYIVSQVIIFVCFAAFLKSLVHFVENTVFAKYAPILKRAPILTLLFGAIMTGIHIFYFAYPQIDKYGLIHWNLHILPRLMIVISIIIITSTIGIMFFINRPKVLPAEKILRLKSILLTFGFCTGGLGTGMSYFFDNYIMLFIGYTLLGIGFLLGLIVICLPKGGLTPKDRFP